jgi:hypothetical protein
MAEMSFPAKNGDTLEAKNVSARCDEESIRDFYIVG